MTLFRRGPLVTVQPITLLCFPPTARWLSCRHIWAVYTVYREVFLRTEIEIEQTTPLQRVELERDAEHATRKVLYANICMRYNYLLIYNYV